jgi:hypothetical protein
MKSENNEDQEKVCKTELQETLKEDINLGKLRHLSFKERIKRDVCSVISEGERMFDECMANPIKYVAVRGMKVVGTAILNIGVEKSLPFILSLIV